MSDQPWADVPDEDWVDVPGAGFVPGWAVNGSPTRARKTAEGAIRADERAKCRADLWEQISELVNHDPWMDAYERWNAICRWAEEEAFGGE